MTHGRAGVKCGKLSEKLQQIIVPAKCTDSHTFYLHCSCRMPLQPNFEKKFKPQTHRKFLRALANPSFITPQLARRSREAPKLSVRISERPKRPPRALRPDRRLELRSRNGLGPSAEMAWLKPSICVDSTCRAHLAGSEGSRSRRSRTEPERLRRRRRPSIPFFRHKRLP